MKFRNFTLDDTEEVLKIYNFHIINGLGNFEERPFSYKKFLKLCTSILKLELPFIICEDNSRIIGFAYLNRFRNKSGYRFSFENSIYIENSFIGKGIGYKLLKKLVLLSSGKDNIKSIIAVIGGKHSKPSIIIHKKNKFRMVGKLRNIGFKKNKWLDAVYMQLEINEKN